MNQANIQSPGVYINELDNVNPVIPAATAIPAFIGYTPQNQHEGKSYLNVPQKISSFEDFINIYGQIDPQISMQYRPEYYFVEQKSPSNHGDFMSIDGKYYAILPDPNTIYYLYNSIKLFYENGGGDAYIVSVGTYGTPSKKYLEQDKPLVNPNVKLNELLTGLQLLKNEKEPTMYICPEATLLSVEENGSLMQAMLQQCFQMKTVIALFDVIGGRNPDPKSYTVDIKTFREKVSLNGLDYGAAYYPFIGTNMMQTSDIDYTNLFGGDIKQLETILNTENNPATKEILNNIKNTLTSSILSQNHNTLRKVSKVYGEMVDKVLKCANILPTTGAIAGIINRIDNEFGTWKAPANISIAGAAYLPINLSNHQQEDLNIDMNSGKSINVIRSFIGNGILVWGARTLDGNSQDWRYISVRRTMIFIEQSCKLIAEAYLFKPNDKNTWESVKTMISNFLTSIWKQGGLYGSKANDAFTVNCGLGSTMTPLIFWTAV